ncbi:orexin receptor type 2-like [Haliotis rufescens]|uniref:orexin receptor type 2-like n=1 Tax=Haliotis rufescens TaxID=6454 RepID=UPI001EAF9836|nr:orexin receptor type 2-like [Haliotis rufescens]
MIITMDQTTSSSNVTDPPLNVTRTLEDVNDAMAITLLPVMLYIGVLMIVGFIGNAMVVYVFIFKFRRGTQNFLITCLAIFDLISCMIAMPTEIVDVRYFYMFNSVFACKLLTFVTTFCAMCSVFTLLGIAIDRYIKVCRPLTNQVKVKHVKIWIVVVVFVALGFSWPSLLIYGIRSADTDVKNITGKDCSTADQMIGTKYPLIYNIVLVAGLLVTTTVLLVLYVFILKAIRIHRIHMKARASFASDTVVSTIEMSNKNISEPQYKTANMSSFKKSERRNKTTVIAFLVTVVFVLSFLPHLALMCTRAIIKDFDHDLRGSSLVAFNIFIRSYFVNSVANPIIYGVLNYKFREECVWLFNTVLCCRRRRVQITQEASFTSFS